MIRVNPSSSGPDSWSELIRSDFCTCLIVYNLHIYIHQEKYFKKTAQLFQEEGHGTAIIETEDEQLLYSYSK